MTVGERRARGPCDRLLDVFSADGVRRVFSHGMRAYYLPLVCGVALTASAFLPWTTLTTTAGEQAMGGVPSVSGFWVLGLGGLACVLSVASIVTRRNSRHPLLLVGLAAFSIMILGEQFLERSAAEQLWARSHARSIVSGTPAAAVSPPTMAIGAYTGLTASALITLFGLTIVVKQVSRPYAEPEDDDA